MSTLTTTRIPIAQAFDSLLTSELPFRFEAYDGSSAGPDDPARIVRVYERLLPYAVLFGQEKEWARELERYYAEQGPDWYHGVTPGFTFAHFSSSIGSLSSTVSSSYSGSSSSSSSGGSGGGGSSGGGGGGGGGGGV